MSRKKWIFLIVFILLSATSYSTEYIVKFKTKSDLKSAIYSFGSLNSLSVKDVNSDGKLLKLTIHQKDYNKELQTVGMLSSRQGVEYVVENIKLYALDMPNDPKIATQWALAKVNAEKAWEIGKGSKSVIIAVIDTGVDYKHEDLAVNMVPGYDFKDNDDDPMDEVGTGDHQNPGHGTHCAGIIGAVGNNGIGISGINQTISIMPLRFLGADGSGDLFASIKAIDYAIAHNVQIISASWGAAVPRSGAQPLIEAIERANQKGIIFVAAAANDGTSNDSREVYPANAGLSNMVVVAASTPDDTKPSWSNFGKATVDLASPGLNIYSTLPGDKYGNLSGTSMATPLVAGVIALLKSKDPSLTGPQARSILQSTGVRVDIETACNCRIDAAAAIQSVEQKKLTVVPAAATIGLDAKLQMSAYGGKAPYAFESSNKEVAKVSTEGLLEGVKEGETYVTVKDANGSEVKSLAIRIGKKAATPPGGGGGKCPFQDPKICLIMCQIAPQMPWCEGSGQQPVPDPGEEE